MKRRLVSWSVVFVFAVLAGTWLGIRAQQEPEPSTTEQLASLSDNGNLWFVELSSPPTADGTSLSVTRGEKAAFRGAAARAGLSFQERFAFDTLWNGLSIRIAPGEVSKLARIEGVRAVYPVETLTVPEPEPELEPALSTALAMTGADIAQDTLGYTGDGVRVAVMDTGIDYHHTDLGGCFGPGCRVETGWDFVGDAYAGPASTPVPDADPDDCQGHGTHVAGIVGASGGLTGVAPDVTFGAYRVFGCTGSTSADIMIAAMERALADGMQVLNMSIGSARQWPQYPTAQAGTRLVNKGVVVVASAGNDGTQGLYASSAPSVGAKVISVASFQNTHINQKAFAVSSDGRLVGYNTATAGGQPPAAGTFPLKRTGTTASLADACSPLPPGSLAGHVALIRRGGCGFYDKSLHAQNAGAAGVVLYNNAAGTFTPTVAGTPPITIPVVAITQADGVVIDGRIAAGATSLTWTDQVVSAVNPVGGLIASSSSYGLSPDLALKPDIGAPGGNILSTYPVELGSYRILSGTSMSSPHVAGAVALLLEARPHTPAQAVRAILQNSADPRVWWGNPGLGFLDNVHRQGAGMLDIDDAILATTKIEPGKLSLGESEFGPAIRTLTIENNAATDVTYDLSHAGALATGPNAFSPAFFSTFAAVTFSAPSVTVPAGGTATVGVTVEAPALLADRSMYGGYVVFTPQGGGAVYRVPYAGFKGDYQSIPVLVPTANGFPWLAKLIGSSYFNQPAGATYTLAAGDVPYFLVHLDHHVRRMRMEVFDANTGKAWHRALDLEHFGRNSSATGFYAISWDATTVAGKKTYAVPSGRYVIRLTVQKALGDDANPAHWETWTSPVITIQR